ncbi:MAG: hypothetical protein M3401_19170 [Actinomycetota bacterium]|nr:hypothetical protein [Actinomycetota bacterium]
MSVAQLAQLLNCARATVTNRRDGEERKRTTLLDDRVDALHYALVRLEAAGWQPTQLRDWLFSKSTYFDGETPAAVFQEGNDEVALVAGQCYLEGYSPEDFAEHLDELGLTAADPALTAPDLAELDAEVVDLAERRAP